MTHACCLDRICNLDEKFLVLGCVLASDEDFDRESAALDLVEVLRCEVNGLVLLVSTGVSCGVDEPFFCVVRMYRVSSVKSIRVVGNS
jgi:hypothetical protein